MYRRIYLILLLVIFFISTQSSIIAAYETTNVKDYLNYLTREEINSLQTAIESAKNEHNLDIVIVITNDTNGKSSMDFADDYYDYNGYGVGNDYSGLLLLVNMNIRELWISTSGRGIDIFTDSRIDSILDDITTYAASGNYYTLCNEFVDNVKYYANQGVPIGQYREERDYYGSSTYLSRVINRMKMPSIYIVALIVSGVATFIITKSSKGKVTIDNKTYEKKDSFALVNSVDNYLRETTTKVKIESSSGGSSGSRSSTHRSSSGRSHGGGGRRF